MCNYGTTIGVNFSVLIMWVLCETDSSFREKNLLKCSKVSIL